MNIISVERLIDKFADMANRGVLLNGTNVTQQDLLMQIIGTIVKTAREEDDRKVMITQGENIGTVGIIKVSTYDGDVVIETLDGKVIETDITSIRYIKEN